MTAEELLKRQIKHIFVNGKGNPPEKFIPEDVALAALQMKENETKLNRDSKGWICPKCGRVYSPSTPQCVYCSNEAIANANCADGRGI